MAKDNYSVTGGKILKGLSEPKAAPKKPTGVPGIPSGTTGTKAAAERCAASAAKKAH